MNIAPLKLGERTLWPPVVLAPMAGVTDAPYRVICEQQGAPLCVSEMITANALTQKNEKTMRMILPHPAQSTHSLQLYGTHPRTLSEAVKIAADHSNVDHIDLNFGCPVPKVTRVGGGAALPFKRKFFAEMVTAAVKAAEPYRIPITVKMRLGIDMDHLTFLDAGRAAQDAGVAWVALHARTAEDLYGETVRWGSIAELVTALDIPVLGNGEIWGPYDAQLMVEQTGCAGVVIGRGCLGRPWLFGQLNQLFNAQEIAEPPCLGEVSHTALAHAALVWEWHGPAMFQGFRKHLVWYLKGFPLGGQNRARAAQVTTVDDVVALLGDLDPTLTLVDSARFARRGHTTGPRRVALPEHWLDDPDEEELVVADTNASSGG